MKKRNAFTPPSSRTTSVPLKREDCCSFCNAVVAPGSQWRIVVNSSEIINIYKAVVAPADQRPIVVNSSELINIYKAVVASADQRPIVVNSSELIHTNCFAFKILDNGLSDIKRDVQSIFKPLFDYNYRKLSKRPTFEELIVDVQLAVKSSKFEDEVKERVLGSISEYLKNWIEKEKRVD